MSTPKKTGRPKAGMGKPPRKELVSIETNTDAANRSIALMFGEYGDAAQAAQAIYNFKLWIEAGTMEEAGTMDEAKCWKATLSRIWRGGGVCRGVMEEAECWKVTALEYIMPHILSGNATFFRHLAESLLIVQAHKGGWPTSAANWRMMIVCAHYTAATARAQRKGRKYCTLAELRKELEIGAARQRREFRNIEHAGEVSDLAAHKHLKERFCEGLEFEESDATRGETGHGNG